MKRILTLTLLFSFYGLLAQGPTGGNSGGGSNSNQNLGVTAPNIIGPSPTVANLMRFEEVPVDLYSGQPQVNIPIHSNALDTKLSLDVGLSYNTSGLRVNSRSGWVGNGWSLNAGGVISRSVRDLPDEINNTIRKGVFYNGYFDQSPHSEELVWNSVRGDGDLLYDSESDLFQFNFFGYTGRFIIIKKGNTLEPRLISIDSKVKISVNYQDGVIESFTVVPPNGYVFVFSAKEITGSIPHTAGTSQSGKPVGGANFGDISSLELKSTTAWLLTEILNSNGETLCELKYNDSYLDAYTTAATTTNNRMNIQGINFEVDKGYNEALFPPRNITSRNLMNVNTQKLQEIRYRDGSKVQFISYSGHPETSNSSSTLSSIVVRNTSGVISKHNFHYTTTPNKRLFLDRIDRAAGGTEYTHAFTYKGRDSLPKVNSPTRDRWGYYNGSFARPMASDLYKPFEDTNPMTVTTGVLSEIKYPTGASKALVFESNTFSYIGSTFLGESPGEPGFNTVTNVLTGSTDAVNGKTSVNETAPFEIVDGRTINNSLVVSILEVSGRDADQDDVYSQNIGLRELSQYYSVSFLPIKPVGGIQDSNSPLQSAPKFVEDSSRNQLDIPLQDFLNGTVQHKDNLIIANGWYKIKIYRHEDFIPEYVVNYRISIDFLFKTYGPGRRKRYGGGIRIKSISDVDEKGVQGYTEYNYTEPNDPRVSSGSFDGTFEDDGTEENRKKAIRKLVTGFREYTNHRIFMVMTNSCLTKRHIDIHVSQFSRDVSVRLTKGHYIGYKTVRTQKRGFGTTTKVYTSPIDFPSDPSIYNYPFIPKDDVDYKRGLPLIEAYYDNNDRLLSFKRNAYEFVKHELEQLLWFAYELQNQPFYRNQFYITYRQGFIGDVLEKNVPSYKICEPLSNVTVNGSVFRILGNNPYTYESGIALLKEQVEAQYFYDGTNTGSNTTGGGIPSLLLVDLPNPKGSKRVITRTTQTYDMANYKIKRREQHVTEGNTTDIYLTEYQYPTSYTSSLYTNKEISAITKMAFRLNNIDEQLGMVYYKNGVLLQGRLNKYKEYAENQILISEIQTVKDTDPVQKRITFHDYDNYANPLEISQSNGGSRTAYLWGYNHTYPVAKIENSSYANALAASGINMAVLNSPGSTTGQKRSELHKLYTPTLHKSFVSTYLYKPLVGMTSTTDPRQYRMTYEYDEFNRLQRVRDADGNILSENRYHYKDQ